MADTVTIRLNEDEKNSLKKASSLYGLSVSSLLKKLAFEKLEDEFDLQTVIEYEKEMKEGKIKLHSFEDVEKELGL